MHIVVVPINEIYTLEAAQIIESLLRSKTVSTSELRDEDKRPFQFVVIAISHDFLVVMFPRLQRYEKLRAKQKILIFFMPRQSIFDFVKDTNKREQYKKSALFCQETVTVTAVTVTVSV
jgi:hypothetical protein